ncbi:MAG TPA: hypothetical protein VM717_05395 [Chthoniobacterales bacterium]|jgi:hypothetical protein|nr:hypothetical protein [Chthoniobacterales bacterium]
MNIFLDRILSLNLVATTVIYYVAARIYLLPNLNRFRPRAVLIPILLLHSLRHLGLMFLTRGATYPGLPSQFAYPAALGDVVTAALALIALFLVTGDSRAARPFVWLFNIFGTVDLAVAITLATVHNASPFMGPAYWIPAFWVPSLLVTHYVTFIILIKHWKDPS